MYKFNSNNKNLKKKLKIKFLTKKKNYNNLLIFDVNKRAMLRNASISHESAAKIRAKANIKVNLSTVPRVLRNAPYLKLLKLMKKSPLRVPRKKTLSHLAPEHMVLESVLALCLVFRRKK